MTSLVALVPRCPHLLPGPKDNDVPLHRFVSPMAGLSQGARAAMAAEMLIPVDVEGDRQYYVRWTECRGSCFYCGLCACRHIAIDGQDAPVELDCADSVNPRLSRLASLQCALRSATRLANPAATAVGGATRAGGSGRCSGCGGGSGGPQGAGWCCHTMRARCCHKMRIVLLVTCVLC